MFKIYLYIFSFLLFSLNSFAQSYKITIYYEERPPYFILDSSKQKIVDGIAFKKVNKILTDSKVKYEYEQIPIIRSLQNIKDNKIPCCVTYTYKNKMREEYARFTLPYLKDKRLVIITKKNNEKLKGANNLIEILSDNNITPILKVGYTYGTSVTGILQKYRGYSIFNLNDQKNKNIVMTSQIQEDILKKLLENEGDFTLMPLNEFQYYIQTNPNFSDILTYKTIPESTEEIYRHFMCSKKVKIIDISKMNEVIKKVRSLN
ncbi:hypothetical protein AXG55_04810 [Silvanigrella aquatica]|uniref:Solute-binding protein family 3/N-terminal domain-containing protein n=2 Tax=Silvanigrella aquatica TaxID=1915309 RepID=A0A1L4CZ82_9BACT|nr:hypothetical protein AXG55_04810 [Silvanigrella aquatica]